MNTQDTVRQIIESLQAKRRTGEYQAIQMILIDLAKGQPEAIASFARACVEESLYYRSEFDALLSHLPESDWSELVSQSVEAMKHSMTNEAARAVVEYAGVQRPVAGHPYLRELFGLDKRLSQPLFREASWDTAKFICADYDDFDAESRSWALQALLQTRLPQAFEFTSDKYTSGSLDYLSALSDVGYELVNREFHPLFTSAVWHIAFPGDYLSQMQALWAGQSITWRHFHPTWAKFQGDGRTYYLGGQSTYVCGNCGKPGHSLLMLDPIPEELGVTTLRKLQVATCLSCLSWERETLYYQHDQFGAPIDLNGNPEDITVEPAFPASALVSTPVQLTQLGDRWKWQEWGLSNGNENLHRIGGHPSWIQQPEYPICPLCGHTLHFLLQLDSGLLTTSSSMTEWLWGSGGICYVFWCDKCKVSAVRVQCT